jgi:hypothetical protein
MVSAAKLNSAVASDPARLTSGSQFPLGQAPPTFALIRRPRSVRKSS